MKTTIKIEVLKNADTLSRIIKAIALHNEGKIKTDLIQLASFFEVEFALNNYHYKDKGAFVEIDEQGEFILLSEDKGETFFCKLSTVSQTAAEQLEEVNNNSIGVFKGFDEPLNILNNLNINQ